MENAIASLMNEQGYPARGGDLIDELTSYRPGRF
jgi:hypothetical protein